MMGAFWSQPTILRRRAIVLGGLVVPVLLTVVASVATIFTAKAAAPDIRGPVQGLSLAQLAAPDGAVVALQGAALLLGVVVLSVAASAVAQEFSLGTLRSLLVQEPRRVQLLLGRFAALSSLGALVGLLAGLVGVAAAWASAAARGLDTSAWTVTGTAAGIGDTILAMVGYALLGCVLGLALRSPAAAIGVAAVWLLPAERIVINLWSAGSQWLPGQLLGSVAAGGDDANSWGRALGLSSLLVAVLVAWAAVLFRRRDVAA